MNKVVFLGTPAYGHVNPTLALVRELVQRGEAVTYYNGEEFRGLIESTGAIFRAYPETEFSSAGISAALQDGNLANVSRLILQATETLLPFSLEALKAEKPDLLIFDSLLIWGRMAATLLNLRAVSSITHFSFDLKAMDITGREFLRYMRQVLPRVPCLLAQRIAITRRYGAEVFPSKPPLIPVRGGLNIVYTSRELHPPMAMIDDTFCFVGPSINPQTRTEDFPFEALDDEPLVYISLGTIHSGRTDFYRQCFAAFGDYPAQFVLSAGRHTDIAALEPIPANFIVRPIVPQIEVLQRASAFITHGGLNSIHEGLYYGVPLLLVPQQFEQLLNARRVATRGAGLVLGEAYLGKAITAADLRQRLEQLLTQGDYREAAARLQQNLRSTGGYMQAADEIQAFIDQKRANSDA